MNTLFEHNLGVVNLGVGAFSENINTAQGESINVDWRPPGEGDVGAARSLARLINNPDIDSANQSAYTRYLESRPVLIGLGNALDVIPDMTERTILHSGPPVDWSQMCGPMQGAVIGAILYEGWVNNETDARKLAAGGEVSFSPCHHYGAVGPMSGVISPSMPVWIVRDEVGGNLAFSNLNEGLGRVLRFGAHDQEVIDRLKWMQSVLAPFLAASLDTLGGIEIKPLLAQALHMGDECHNRNVASTSLLIKMLLPAALRSGLDDKVVASCTEFMARNDHFFLNISMAACKTMMDASEGVAGSSLVTAMARNGVYFGIRISGGGDRWFTTEAPVVDGLYFPGYSILDAAPDLGDSAITETAGLGGFAMAASPAIVQFVGGSPADAILRSREMALVTLGQNSALTLPALNFAGTPAGIDACQVVDQNITPIINTGIAHKEAGIGQIGAGITRAPMSCFTQAVQWLDENFLPSGDGKPE